MRTKHCTGTRPAALALLAGVMILGGTGPLRADPPADAELRAAREKIAEIEAAVKSLTAANEKSRDENAALKKSIARMETQLAEAAASGKFLQVQIGAVEKELAAEKKKNAEFGTIVQASLTETKGLLADRKALKALLDKAEKENADLQAAASAAREKQVKTETDLLAAKEARNLIETRAQELIKENARLAKQVGTGTPAVTPVAPAAANPPDFAVEGKVVAVSAEGLVEINVGSATGLKKGHTLEVFRLAPKPRYLGMIRLVTVDEKRSVGQIVGKPTAPLQREDNVAGKLLEK
jgi:hypothetical protein